MCKHSKWHLKLNPLLMPRYCLRHPHAAATALSPDELIARLAGTPGEGGGSLLLEMWETGASAAAGWECTAHLLRAVQAPGFKPCSGMRSALAYNQDLQASGNV
jgi:hypothetical protein